MNTSFDESEKKERLISLLRKFEQELLDDNNEKRSNKRKWFSWHWFPEEPIKLNSVVEMTVFLLICISCFFLYYRWNTVPNKEFEIQIEDLSNGVVYDSTRVQVDSVRRVFACNINYNIPMTRHEKFVEGLKSCTIDLYPLFSDGKYSDFLNYTFLNDSVRNGLIKNDSCTHTLLNKYNLKKEYKYNDRFENASKIINTLKKAFLDSLYASQDSCVMVAVSTKQSLPFLSQSMWHGWRRTPGYIYHNYYSDDKKYFLSDSYLYFDNRTNNDKVDPRDGIEIEQKRIERSTLSKILRSFNFYRPFTSGGTMMTPDWGRLEDISQAYISLKLESYTIDSIVINLNFVGATEFSQMDPIPDKVGMSNIIFNDPVKIYKIKANGLRFHARFIELENWQQIRVFTVTAIMSAFVLIFVVFAISSYFKVRKKIRGKGGLIINKSVYWVFTVLIGIILYTFLYWTFMTFAIDETLTFHIFNMSIADSVIKCNLLTIPITVLILLLSNRKGRQFLVNTINNRYFKNTAIFVSICLFIVLLCSALYKVVNMDYDTLIKYQKYGRAAKQIYSDLINRNKASKDDVIRLRQALLASGEPIQSPINGKFKDDILVSYDYFRDSLNLYDLQNGRSYCYQIPQMTDVEIYDGLIIVEALGWHFYILKRDNHRDFRLIDMGKHIGNFAGLTNKNETAIFYEYDTITYAKIADKTNCRRLPFTCRLNGLHPKKIADNYLMSTFVDSFYIYKVRDSFQVALCYKAICKNDIRTKKIANNENVYFLNTEEELLLYKNNDIDYIVDLTSGENYIDSLPEHYWRTEIKPSPLWNRKTINVLKRASANNNITYMGLDHTNIYLYNFRDTCVEAYNKVGNSVGKLKLNRYGYRMPVLYSNSEGTYFVQMQSDSIYKYSMNGLVDKKPIKQYARNSYVNDYIIEEDNNKIIVRPYTNPSDSFVVMNIDGYNGYFDQDDIQIINGWMVCQDPSGHYRGYNGHNRYYIENVISTNSLILNSKYLTNGQKDRLIGILKKEED